MVTEAVIIRDYSSRTFMQNLSECVWWECVWGKNTHDSKLKTLYTFIHSFIQSFILHFLYTEEGSYECAALLFYCSDMLTSQDKLCCEWLNKENSQGPGEVHSM